MEPFNNGETKTCKECNESKPATLEFFFRENPGGLRNKCKKCTGAANQRYNADPKVKQRTAERRQTPLSRTKASYTAMKSRCLNPKHVHYGEYGGAGIKICDRWLGDVNLFVKDVGLRPSVRHSLDRFPDNNGNYEPGNVRWATPKQQSHNRRDIMKLEFQGKTLTIWQWAKKTGIPARTLWRRVRNAKWSAERALTVAVRLKNPNGMGRRDQSHPSWR